MAGYALDEFNQVLPDMEAAFTEDWVFGSSTFPAIAIERSVAGSKVMSGGQLKDVHTEIFIREDVYQSSAVKKGSIISARGLQLAVLEINQDGDASRMLMCGPAGIDLL